MFLLNESASCMRIFRTLFLVFNCLSDHRWSVKKKNRDSQKKKGDLNIDT